MRLGIRRVLRIPLQSQRGRGGRDAAAVQLAQRVVHGQRAGLARLVLQRGDGLAAGCQQMQGGKVGDGGELLQALGKMHGGELEKLRGSAAFRMEAASNRRSVESALGCVL